jgi:release factor glutamine methyltransferase
MDPIDAQTKLGALLSRGMTIADTRRALAQAFRAAGIDSPEADARILIGHALGLDRTALATQPHRIVTAAEAEALRRVANRRLSREPVARILGEKEFWGLSLRLNAATLVPRPETETVVEAALAAIDARGPRTRALRLADLGAGTGALLLALLSELPNAHGVATDLSGAALAMARDNAARLGLSPRAQFVRCDFGGALQGGFDIVVSNPPYIPTGDLDGLEPEVLRDPTLALDGGADGLAAYRVIAADVPRLLVRGGVLIVELGIGQEAGVAGIMRERGLSAPAARPDLAGVPRALTALLP